MGHGLLARAVADEDIRLQPAPVRCDADQQVPEKMQKIAKRLMERYKLRVADFDKMKKDPENFRKFFKAYNESFDGIVHNFIPFTEAEIEEEIGEIGGQLDKRLCCVLLDEEDEVAAFGISTPWLSEAMKKAKGSLFPFGWYHALKAKNELEVVDLMLSGAAPKWQNSGISAVFHAAGNFDSFHGKIMEISPVFSTISEL
jgi:hypothetical protein